MKKLQFLSLLILFLSSSFTFENSSTQTVHIKTSAVCEMCKERLENKLNYTKGIVYAELDVDTKILTVKYKVKYIHLDDIKQIISDTGYHADEVPRNEHAFKHLPPCCQDKNAVCEKK